MRRRLYSIALTVATVVGILPPAGLSATFAQGPLIGRASVIDGDTIEIAGEKIRFNGVDAPESWQICVGRSGAEYRCGKAAAEALDGFLAQSRPTRCDFIDRDRYGRFVGDCYRSDGTGVAAWAHMPVNRLQLG
jgi:endonuclease YncB( thermonuclease family)